MQLYIGNKNYSSWSLRPWVLMRSFGLEFEEVLVPFDGSDNYERFKSFSPNGRVPCLIDGDVVIWESLAIIDYLAEGCPELWPSERLRRAYAKSIVAEMHAGFQVLRADCPLICKSKFQIRIISSDLRRELDRLEEIFEQGFNKFGGPYLLGSTFCAADAFYVPVALRVLGYQLPLSAKSVGYCEQLRGLPAVKEWVQDAIKEPWRDAEEETAARKCSDWQRDLDVIN